MKRMMILVLGALLASTASRGEAALVSSSKTFSQKIESGFSLASQTYLPNGNLTRSNNFFMGRLMAGVASATVTTDTTADTGVVDAMGFLPFSVTSSMHNEALSRSYTVIDVPANFPDPAVTHTVSGQWTERITISGVTGLPPTFISSTTNGLNPFLNTLPWFSVFNDLTFSTPSFTLTGTYQVIGPQSTLTIPLSMEFQGVAGPVSSTFAVKGGPGFGSGFDFVPLDVYASYHPVNPAIFDGLVDGLRFVASFADQTSNIRFAQNFVPEPASLAMAGFAMGLALVRRRR